MRYDQLNKEAQARAITQVDQNNPVALRTLTLDKLVLKHTYDKDGWIIYGDGSGQDPDYYNGMLAD